MQLLRRQACSVQVDVSLGLTMNSRKCMFTPLSALGPQDVVPGILLQPPSGLLALPSWDLFSTRRWSELSK